MQISTTLQETVRELRHFKVLKMGQNLYANMEGFRRAGHKYPDSSCLLYISITVAMECVKM